VLDAWWEEYDNLRPPSAWVYPALEEFAARSGRRAVLSNFQPVHHPSPLLGPGQSYNAGADGLHCGQL